MYALSRRREPVAPERRNFVAAANTQISRHPECKYVLDLNAVFYGKQMQRCNRPHNRSWQQPFGRMRDGVETQFETDHLGDFRVCEPYRPADTLGGQPAGLSSSGHRVADIDLQDQNFDQSCYDPSIAYGRSITANILLAVAFDRRYRSRSIRATDVRPSGIRIELSRHLGPGAYEALIEKINSDLATEGEPPYQAKTIAQGAATSVWAEVVAVGDDVGGRYCENCHASTITDGPLGPGNEGVRAYALDPEHAELLWVKSDEIIGERFWQPQFLGGLRFTASRISALHISRSRSLIHGASEGQFILSCEVVVNERTILEGRRNGEGKIRICRSLGEILLSIQSNNAEAICIHEVPGAP